MEQQLLFPCGRGHEQPLALELENLGLRDIKIGHAVVSGRGSLELAYRGCLWLRTASRVLLPLADGEVNDPDDIYALVKGIAWEDHLDPNCTFAVFFNGTGQGIRNTQFGALKCKDAIADRLLERYRRRPDVDNKEPDISIDVHLRRGQLTVSLDLSGGGLHRRGYRHNQGAAPIKENLAAAMLYRCQWPELSRQGFNLIDPLCGSGTLLLEGLQMAADIAPALGRERFGFSAWLPHKPSQWRQLIEEAQQRREEGLNRLELKIWGFDQDREAIFAAKENARRLGLGHCLHLEVSPLDRFAWVKAYGEQGLLISNPPYGERLGSTIELIPTYERLGAAFKGFPAGWQLALVSSNAALLQRLHLKSHRHYQAQNGSLDVSINLYRRDEQREEVGTNPAPPSGFGGGEQGRMFANRLRKNFKKFQTEAAQLGTDAYRVYDRDMPEYAVAVDLYGDRLHIQEYAPPPTVRVEKARERLLDVLAIAPEVLGIARDKVYLKTRQRQAGKSQYEKQDKKGEFFPVREGAAQLLVNLSDYLDTGLFLDHRPLRRRIFQEAAGQRFLNLFCYTGSFSVQAALGGASLSTSVDLSGTYLDWAARNFTLNGLGGRHRLVKSDVLSFLEKGSEQFDLIVCDPPTFSNTKKSQLLFDVQRDQQRLLELTMNRLAPGGSLYFSNNYQRFKLAPQLEERYRVERLELLDFDFSRRPKIHQIYWFRHR